MHQVATPPRRQIAGFAYIDRKLELLERMMADMSDVIDEYEEFGDYDDDDLDGDVVHDRYDELRNYVIDVEELVAELRAKLGTSDGKVFP